MADNADDLLTMKNKTYTTFAVLKLDIKDFTQYCRKEFPEHEQSVKELIKSVNRDLNFVNNCAQCYEHQVHYPNPMVLLCEPLHLLVWAKTKGFNYWPAKLLKLQGTNAHVIYFGEYLDAKVVAAECLIYTKERPDKQARIVNYGLFKTAIQDAEVYANNIKESFGHFNYAKGKVYLSTKSLMEHISDMTAPTSIDENLSVRESSKDNQQMENKSQQVTEPSDTNTPKSTPAKPDNFFSSET